MMIPSSGPFDKGKIVQNCAIWASRVCYNEILLYFSYDNIIHLYFLQALEHELQALLVWLLLVLAHVYVFYGFNEDQVVAAAVVVVAVVAGRRVLDLSRALAAAGNGTQNEALFVKNLREKRHFFHAWTNVNARAWYHEEDASFSCLQAASKKPLIDGKRNVRRGMGWLGYQVDR